MHGVPPVPPIPESLRDKSVSPTGASAIDSQDFARPKTAPNGSAAKKGKSVKSGASRGRSGDREKKHRESEVQGKKPDFSEFLDSIGNGDDGFDDDGEVDGMRTTGMGKAPY